MLNLQDVVFSVFPDFVFNMVAEPIPLNADRTTSIFNDGDVATLSGGDFVVARLFGAVTTSDDVSLAAFANTGSIATDWGADHLVGRTVVYALGGTSLTATGLENEGGTIATGRGGDTVRGVIEGTTTVFDYLNPTGLLGGTIVTDGGNDRVIGEAAIVGGYRTTLDQPTGIFGAAIDTGAGRDSVIGTVEASALPASVIESSDGIELATIITGPGGDLVLGDVEVTGASHSTILFSDGIDSAVIETGGGNDRVIGRSTVSAGYDSAINDSDGIDDTDVSTGAGNDLVMGISSLSGMGLVGATGDGFFADLFVGGTGDTVPDEPNVIDTGTGNDRVIGIGADIAIVDETSAIPLDEQSSEGIDGYVVLLGAGNDTVYARGASAGVKNVFIDGGRGRDVFDLHSGTGSVDGGGGFDTLILGDDSTTFDFDDTGFLEGTISDGSTELDVAAVERFRFDDGAFWFYELFG